MKVIFESNLQILEEAVVDEMEEDLDNPIEERKNLVFRVNDHCHCERVEHSVDSGVDVVDLQLLLMNIGI